VPAENRERVLRAATSSFLARGAGVAKQTVYAHFPSKDALFKEVAQRCCPLRSYK
jgi:AcrR family transcriptional regulator